MGARAVESGLIDRLGGLHDALGHLPDDRLQGNRGCNSPVKTGKFRMDFLIAILTFLCYNNAKAKLQEILGLKIWEA